MSALKLAAVLWLAATTAAADVVIEVAAARGDVLVARWRYQVTHTGREALTDARFTAAVPLPRHGDLTLLRLRVTHPASRTPSGLEVRLGRLEPGASAMVTVTAELARGGVARDRAAATPAGTSTPSTPAIAAFADAVRAAPQGKRGEALLATLSHLTPDSFHAAPRAVENTLRLGRGDCTDLALVVAAVASAAGLPTRLASGWPLGASGLLGPEAVHDWAEIFEGGRWRAVDLHARAVDRTDLVATFTATDGTTGRRFSTNEPQLDIRMLAPGGTTGAPSGGAR